MKIVLTGKMDTTRDEEYERFSAYGIEVMKNVTSTTDYLLKGTRPGQRKIQDANIHGTPQMSEHEFFDMLVDKFPEIIL